MVCHIYPVSDANFSVDRAVCFSLYSATNTMLATYRGLLAPFGLTYQQYLVIQLLSAEKAMTVGALADRLVLEASAASGLVRRLVGAGILAKDRGAQDQRVVTVVLTEHGLQLESELTAVAPCFAASAGLSIDAADQLIEELTTLRGSLEDARLIHD
jgi:MarR family transcriptional regulator, organic hydroperoxide resistance regulator